MGVVRYNGVGISYRCVGSGEDVVCIHGLAANQAFWNHVVVKDLSENRRLTVYDLRGHGYSSMPTDGYTSADMADDLHQLLNHLDISSAHLVGHSFGGLVALQYASAHAERVNSITLADVRVRAFQPTQRAEDWPSREATKKMLESCGLKVPDDVEEAGLWMLEKLSSPEWLETRENLKKKLSFSPLGKSKRAAGQWRKVLQETTAKDDILSDAGLTKKVIAGIGQPTLGIYGEYSPALRSLEGLQQLMPNFHATTVPGGGHFFPMSRPKLFAGWVNEFLEKVDTAENTA